MPTSANMPATASRARPSRRAVVVWALLAVGYLTARYAPTLPAAAWFSIAAACCAIAGATSRWACKVALTLGMLAFGGGWWTVRIAERPRDPLWAFVETLGQDDQQIVSIEALVIDEPRAAPPTGAMSMFALREPFGTARCAVSALKADVGWLPCEGTVVMRVRGTTWSAREGLGGFGVHAGDRVRVTGIIAPTHAPMNPGEPDARLLAAQDNTLGTFRVEQPDLIERAPGAGTTWSGLRSDVVARIARARAACARLLEPRPVSANDPARAALADRSRALIASLLLGRSEPGEAEVRGVFTRLGLAHVLAISGFHVTVAVGLVLLLVRLTGDRGRLEAMIVGVMVCAYIALVPADAPVVRAGIMVLALLTTRALGRRYDTLNTLAWTGVGLLLWRPMDLWSLGFQLSLGLTAILLWRGVAFHERLFGMPIRGLVRIGNPPGLLRSAGAALKTLVARAVSTSVLCWLASMPLIVVTTGLVSPLAVLAGLVVVPAAVALMWLGYGVLLFGLIANAFGLDPSDLTQAMLGLPATWIVRATEVLDSLPGSAWRAPGLSVWWGATATVVIVWWAAFTDARRRAVWAVAVLVVAWAGCEAAWARIGSMRQRVQVTTLAGGEGACTLIQGNGDCVLWNCGGGASGARALTRAAFACGVYHAPVVVIAGADVGSFSALADVAAGLGVREVWVSPEFERSASREKGGAAEWLKGWLAEHSITTREIRGGESIGVGAGELTLHLSGRDARLGAGQSHNEPDLSDEPGSVGAVVGMLRVVPIGLDGVTNSPSYLFGGELRDQDEAWLINGGAGLRAVVCEGPRHTGSRKAAAALAERTAALVIVSRSRDLTSLQSSRWFGARAVDVRSEGATRVRMDARSGVRISGAR